jgi:hypothetical protein
MGTEEARVTGLPHNDARAKFAEIVTYVLTERAVARIGRGWLTRDDRQAWDHLRSDLADELAESDAFTAALDELWPILTPETLLSELYTSHDRLRAAGADAALFRADVRPGRCRTCRCSTSWSTCWAVTSRRTTPPSVNDGRSRIRGGRTRPDDQPRGSDGRRGPSARHGHAARPRILLTRSSNATPANSSNVLPQTGIGHTGMSSSTRRRSCPKWIGGC